MMSLFIKLLAAASCVSAYTLTKQYAAPDFFDGFVFQSSEYFESLYKMSDPTNGESWYSDRATAESMGLVSITPQNTVRIAVDTVTEPAAGYGRRAVRLSSNDQYANSLIIADIVHIPFGKGVWPALWTVNEKKWPNGGEIDIIEQIDFANQTRSAVHTGKKCRMPFNIEYNDEIRNCNIGYSDAGCSVDAPRSTHGPAFATAGGGTFAMERTRSAIKVWFWSRTEQVPEPILSPVNTWKAPYAVWPLGAACPAALFGPHNITINTALCGDWTSMSNRACRQLVRNNAAAYVDAYWELNWIRVYT